MSDQTPIFLTPEQVVQLTGRKRRALQIAWLRKEGIPFRVTAVGVPIVTRSAIESAKPAPEPEAPQRWQPRVIAGGT